MVEPMEDSQHVIAVLAAGLQWRPHRRRHQYANKPFAEDPPLRPPLPVPLRRPREVSASQQAPPECRSKSAPWNILCQPGFLGRPLIRWRRSHWRAFARPLPMELHRATSVPRLTHSPAASEGRLCGRESRPKRGCRRDWHPMAQQNTRYRDAFANTWKVKSTPRPLGHTQFADPTSGLRRQLQTQCSRLA